MKVVLLLSVNSEKSQKKTWVPTVLVACSDFSHVHVHTYTRTSCKCVFSFNKHLKKTCYTPGLAIGSGDTLVSNKSRVPAFMVERGTDSEHVNKHEYDSFRQRYYCRDNKTSFGEREWNGVFGPFWGDNLKLRHEQCEGGICACKYSGRASQAGKVSDAKTQRELHWGQDILKNSPFQNSEKNWLKYNKHPFKHMSELPRKYGKPLRWT